MVVTALLLAILLLVACCLALLVYLVRKEAIQPRRLQAGPRGGLDANCTTGSNPWPTIH